jgi:hypothetical protein
MYYVLCEIICRFIQHVPQSFIDEMLLLTKNSKAQTHLLGNMILIRAEKYQVIGHMRPARHKLKTLIYI